MNYELIIHRVRQKNPSNKVNSEIIIECQKIEVGNEKGMVIFAPKVCIIFCVII